MALTLRLGFEERHRPHIAALYWHAFGPKLGTVLRPEAKALTYIAQSLLPSHAITATWNGNLCGVVGFATAQGALVQGGPEHMRAIYGAVGATWRMHLLDLLMTPSDGKSFLMDGIFVAQEARNQGIGRALLTAFENEGRARGYSHARLEVIEQNLRAQALYTRQGWRIERKDDIGWLRHIYGFRRTLVMGKAL